MLTLTEGQTVVFGLSVDIMIALLPLFIWTYWVYIKVYLTNKPGTLLVL